MTTYTTFQTETGGYIVTPIATTIPATSGYAFFVGRGVQYQVNGFVTSGSLYIARSGVSNLPAGKYEMLPQVVDSRNLIYFLDPADVEVERTLSSTQTAFVSGDSFLNRLIALENAMPSGNIAYYDTSNTFTTAQTIAPETDSVALTVKAFGQFPQVELLDNFNRSNGTLGSNWSTMFGTSGLTISGNKAVGVSNDFKASAYTANTYSNVDIVLEVGDLGSSTSVYTGPEIHARRTNDNNWYSLFYSQKISTSEYMLGMSKKVGGSFSVIQSDTPVGSALQNGDAIGFRLIGNSLQGWVRRSGAWTKIIDLVDSSLVSGYVGIALYQENDTASVDNFSAAELSVQTEDIVEFFDADGDVTFRLNKAGYPVLANHSAPADADLAAGECALWFDQTNGSAKLKIKAKQANGTVRVGEVALT